VARTKKYAVRLLQFAVSLAILTWLIWDAQRADNDVFTRLWVGDKNWMLLGLATSLVATSVLCTFVRWYLLATAVDLPFRLTDAVRLGCVGYVLNFVSLGSVGGDLFKAVFIAREQPGRRAQAVATVLVDRVLGLYGLFVVAAGTSCLLGLYRSEIVEVRTIAQATLGAAAAGTLGLALLLAPGFTSSKFWEWLARLPKIGGVLGQLVAAMRLYRKRKSLLFASVAISLMIHTITIAGFACLAAGLPGMRPSLGTQFVAVPLAMVAGALPLPLNGLGAFEGVLEFLYLHLPGESLSKGQGLLVALAYRIVTIAIAAVCMLVYFQMKRDLAAALNAESSDDRVLTEAAV
jgi:glycosyltransferase 2 family protein